MLPLEDGGHKDCSGTDSTIHYLKPSSITLSGERRCQIGIEEGGGEGEVDRVSNWGSNRLKGMGREKAGTTCKGLTKHHGLLIGLFCFVLPPPPSEAASHVRTHTFLVDLS